MQMLVEDGDRDGRGYARQFIGKPDPKLFQQGEPRFDCGGRETFFGDYIPAGIAHLHAPFTAGWIQGF